MTTPSHAISLWARAASTHGRPAPEANDGPVDPVDRDIYTDGDTVIVFFDAEGTARDGLPYRNTYAWFLGLRDGQIVKASAFFDSIVFNDLWQRVPA